MTTTMTKPDPTPETVARIAEANEALDQFGPITSADLVRPFVQWLDYLLELADVVRTVGGPQECDADLHERAVALSRILDRAGDLVAMYAESHVPESHSAAGLHARGMFEAVTGARGLRRDVVIGDDYWSILAETAK